MSNGRRLRRQTQRAAALEAARETGCTCKPIVRPAASVDGVPRVVMRHDADCPLIGHRQFVIYPQKECRR